MANENIETIEPGVQYEDTWITFSDLIYYVPGTTLTNKKFFNPSETKPDYMRNRTFRDLIGKEVHLFGMQITHLMAFTPRASEPAGAALIAFEQFSKIQFTIQDKVYDPLCLAQFLPYVHHYDYSATENQYFVHNDPSSFMNFKDPIKIPKSGNVIVDFVAAPNLVLAASGGTNPHLYDVNLENNYGFWVKLYLIGKQVRGVS